MKLLEAISIFKFNALLKTDNELNLSEILNELRAVPYVIIIRTIDDPRLEARGTEAHTFSLLSVKLLDIDENPDGAIQRFVDHATKGDGNMRGIPGIIQLIPIKKTLKKVGR